MIEAGAGTIVNVSSNATRGIYRVPYAAAKGGVNAITMALAMETAKYGIRVVATAPGGTEAPERRIARGPQRQDAREREWYQQIVDQVTDSSLLKRYGTSGRAGRGDHLPRLRRSLLHHRDCAPCAGGDLG